MIRRALYVAVPFSTETPIFHIMFILYLNTFVLIFVGNNKPIEGRFKNKLEIVNEVFVHLISMHIIFFTDWIGDPDMQYNMGWSMILLISL